MRLWTAALACMFLAPTLTGAEPPAEQAGDPQTVVEQATAGHIEILTGLIEKVPAPAREKVQKAIEASRRGGEKAVEALRRAHASGLDAAASMDGSQIRGLERAIQAVEYAADRATSSLEAAMERVPAPAAEVISAAISRIDANHATLLARLEGLMERGVSTLHPPARPEAPGLAGVRPPRPEAPTQLARPILPPALVLPERPPRPEGRP